MCRLAQARRSQKAVVSTFCVTSRRISRITPVTARNDLPQWEAIEGQNKEREMTVMKMKLIKGTIGSLIFACAVASLVAAMGQGTSATARSEADERVCSVHTLRGLYLSSGDGYANVGANLVPTTVMEGKRFNGDGTFSNDFGTVNIGGTTIIDTGGFGGTYTVAADCTGTLSVPNGPSFNMYIGPGAQKIWFTQTAGGLGVGTATRLPE